MIVIPMLGNSSRFFDAGFTRPKYELPLAGRTVFDWVLKSFARYFESELFLLAVRRDFEAEDFVRTRLQEAGVKRFEIIAFDGPTDGQATSVYHALLQSSQATEDEQVIIFNADSFLPEFVLPDDKGQFDGYLDVFRGVGDHWSFVDPGESNTVRRTTEKRRISPLCSNGLYIFATAKLFTEIYRQARIIDNRVNGEFYIAPVYNQLIESGGIVKYREIPTQKCVFCGTPAEYDQLLKAGWDGF